MNLWERGAIFRLDASMHVWTRARLVAAARALLCVIWPQSEDGWRRFFCCFMPGIQTPEPLPVCRGPGTEMRRKALFGLFVSHVCLLYLQGPCRITTSTMKQFSFILILTISSVLLSLVIGYVTFG